MIDSYVVAVLKDNVTVGLLPRQLLRILSLVLLKNGTINCVVIGGRRYSSDLPQGGSEIPCKLILMVNVTISRTETFSGS